MIKEELKRGVIHENPVFGLVLGLCPALAITTSAMNAVGMGLLVIFTLTCSNIVISLTKKLIPNKVRLPCYLTIIAAIVTIADLWMKAHALTMNRQLGIFVPLVAVNCIILTRAESYALKKNAWRSAIDGIVMGLGFFCSLLAVAMVRELLGSNKLFGLTVFPGVHPISLFIFAPGGFFTFAALLWIRRLFSKEKRTS